MERDGNVVRDMLLDLVRLRDPAQGGNRLPLVLVRPGWGWSVLDS